MALKVLLADDHRMTLAGLRRVLEEAGDIVVVGEAYSGADVWLSGSYHTTSDVLGWTG